MDFSDCERWIEIRDRRALADQPLAREEADFEREHLSLCATCRGEHAAWNALGGALSDPELLTQPFAAHLRPSPEKEAPQVPSRPSRWGKRRVFVAALLPAAAALGFYLSLRGQESAATVSEERATLVMVAGAVEVGGVKAVSGATLTRDSFIVVARGRACLTFQPKISVCLEGPSRARIAELGPHRRSVRLESGRILAKLGPQPRGATFDVETPTGSVVAHGTVFAVDSAGKGPASVRVHEGTVLLRDFGGAEQELAAPGQVELSDPIRPRPLDAAAMKLDQDLVRLAELSLAPGASCRLDVSTLPQGATVSLDDLRFGPAPVSALVGDGQRISVEHPGYSPVTERLLLRGAKTVVRNYELVPLTPPAPAEPSATPEQESAPRGQASPLSAAELLSRSRALRAAGRYAEAAKTYRTLLQFYPRSDEARASLVSLGELSLSQLGDAAGALRSFEAYLKSGGALSREARYGRIRALGNLGRGELEERAIREFIRDYPQSAQSSSLRAKLSAP